MYNGMIAMSALRIRIQSDHGLRLARESWEVNIKNAARTSN
jgi:hypothetical protein